MTPRPIHGLRRLCDALPQTKLDEPLASLSALQRLLVLAVTTLVVLTLLPQFVPEEAMPTVGVALAIGTMHALSTVVAWYNQR